MLLSQNKEPLWIFPKDNSTWRDSIVKEFKIHPVTAQILVSRGFLSREQIHKFLYAKLPELFDPMLFSEMAQAVDRVLYAYNHQENILIYGDNDVDGMTGAALLTDFFRFVGLNCFFYISKGGTLRDAMVVEAVEYAKVHQCKLLITVDCAISAGKEIDVVTKNKIDVIITDHHESMAALPSCSANLNPKLSNNEYPNRDLTGVGVAFKLAHAVTERLIKEGKIPPKKVDLKRYLDLVALGTIADMAPLLNENRILVTYGLKQLQKPTKRIGLVKLAFICNEDIQAITSYIIATKIAPRLNSLGRIADPNKGVEMLLIRNTVQAEKMAQELDLNNIERQKIERTISLDVEEMILDHPEILDQKAIILHSDKWHPGVIAILSARISKQYNRPTVLIAIDEGLGKASLRSIPEFPLMPVLKECSDFLLNFGGHRFAAGFVIEQENIERFKKKFLKIANSKLKDTDVIAKLYLDAKVEFEDLTFDFMDSISLFEPFGNENPPPILYTEAKQAWPPKVFGNNLKLYLEQGDRMLEGIAFGKAHLSPQLRRRNLILQVAFTPQISAFQGQSIQLLIREIKILPSTKSG